MFRSKLLIVMLVISVVMISCSGVDAGSPPPSVDDIVAATLSALTAQSEVPTPALVDSAGAESATPDSGPPIVSSGGTVGGNLSYPSSFIPAMAVVAFRVGGTPTDYYYVITNENDSTYTISGMVNGEYYIVAYPLDNPTYPGAYTQSVLCGLTYECSDHSLIAVPVANGAALGDINPGDFYAPPGSFPVFPLP